MAQVAAPAAGAGAGAGAKRMGKRSILGTRVSAPGEDGRFYPAVIQVKNKRKVKKKKVI